MPSSPAPAPARRGVRASLQEYGRGVVGGLLFSLPLLYTMEMWWTGLAFSPARLIVGLAFGFALLLLYNRFAGLRPDAGWAEVAIDSVEELGLGLALAAGLLALLGQLGGESVPLGLVLVEGIGVAIGVSVGTAQLGTASEADSGTTGDENQGPTLGSDLALGLCGAVLLALNVAPTDEIPEIAAALSRAQLVGVAALGFGLGAVALFFSDFHGSRARRAEGAGHLVRGAVDTYAVALLAAGGLLWFFGRFDGATPLAMAAQTVVLGLPAALGASAGRLLLRPGDGPDGDDGAANEASNGDDIDRS